MRITLARALEDVGAGMKNFGRSITQDPWLLGIIALIGLAAFNAREGNVSGLLVNAVALLGVATVVAVYRH